MACLEMEMACLEMEMNSIKETHENVLQQLVELFDSRNFMSLCSADADGVLTGRADGCFGRRHGMVKRTATLPAHGCVPPLKLRTRQIE
jgi:hypothetical protein